jgi:hypothetical protein
MTSDQDFQRADTRLLLVATTSQNLSVRLLFDVQEHVLLFPRTKWLAPPPPRRPFTVVAFFNPRPFEFCLHILS